MRGALDDSANPLLLLVLRGEEGSAADLRPLVLDVSRTEARFDFDAPPPISDTERAP